MTFWKRQNYRHNKKKLVAARGWERGTTTAGHRGVSGSEAMSYAIYNATRNTIYNGDDGRRGSLGPPCRLSGKESACKAGDVSSIPGSGRSPGDGSGSPRQCSCLGDPTDRGAWRATVYGGCKGLDTTQ